MKTSTACLYLAMSKWKLRNLVQEGAIPYLPGNGTASWLFDRKDLDEFIDRGKIRFGA